MIIFGTHDQNTLDQINDVASRAVRTALMADGHLGYVMPIGGVAAYDNQVSPVGVGFDIACGNAAIKTDLMRADLPEREGLADVIASTISFGIGRNNNSDDAPTDHALFDDPAWKAIPDQAMKAKARNQLGTVGGGNHYVDIFEDETGAIWIGVHFGSRGFGHTVASGFLNLSMNKAWHARPEEQEVLLDLDTELGALYWQFMTLCGEYAYVGREWVCRKVLSLLGGHEVELIHNHHNFAWKETHEGEELIVIRKGCTPAWPGQLSFVGGSMGDNSVILKGSEWGLFSARAAMFSTVHGAGRVMSRSQAKGNRKQTRAGLITREMMADWLKEKDVVVRGGDVDESPHVYRRLDEVLKAQGATIEVVHTLKPLIVVMAGADIVDPYKD